MLGRQTLVVLCVHLPALFSARLTSHTLSRCRWGSISMGLAADTFLTASGPLSNVMKHYHWQILAPVTSGTSGTTNVVTLNKEKSAQSPPSDAARADMLTASQPVRHPLRAVLPHTTFLILEISSFCCRSGSCTCGPTPGSPAGRCRSSSRSSLSRWCWPRCSSPCCSRGAFGDSTCFFPGAQ